MCIAVKVQNARGAEQGKVPPEFVQFRSGQTLVAIIGIWAAGHNVAILASSPYIRL
jgi:hypothetical protein